MNKIDVVIGPTASGKSIYAVNMALESSAEIISADAFQVYNDFNIGTGKLTEEEKQGVPHHLMSYISPSSLYSVQQFLDDVEKTIDQINKRGVPIIICGGSAMYLKALLCGYKPLKRLIGEDRPHGEPLALWKELKAIDPELADKTPYQNYRRVQRYLELFIIYKKPPSELFVSTRYDKKKYKVSLLLIEKDVLKQRINKRIESMFNNGLVDEVKYLMKQYGTDSLAFNAIGYREVIEYLNHLITFEDMVEKIKLSTYRYAKHQMTWFKRFEYSQIVSG